MPIDPQKIQDHEAKLGKEKVHLLRAGKDGQYEVLVRDPSRPAFRRFLATSGFPDRRGDALEQLVRDCLLEPEPKALESMLDERPALGGVFGEKLCEFAGIGLEVEGNA